MPFVACRGRASAAPTARRRTAKAAAIRDVMLHFPMLEADGALMRGWGGRILLCGFRGREDALPVPKTKGVSGLTPRPLGPQCACGAPTRNTGGGRLPVPSRPVVVPFARHRCFRFGRLTLTAETEVERAVGPAIPASAPSRDSSRRARHIFRSLL